MPDDLKEEIAVSPLINELSRWQWPNREAAEDKWSRAEAQILFAFVTLEPDERHAVSLTKLLLRDDQFP